MTNARPMLYDQFIRECPRALRDEWVTRIGRATVVVADNVADYLGEHPEWILPPGMEGRRRDFHGLRLPWDSAWIEANVQRVKRDALQAVRSGTTRAAKVAIYAQRHAADEVRCVFFGRRCEAEARDLKSDTQRRLRWIAGSFSIETDESGAVRSVGCGDDALSKAFLKQLKVQEDAESRDKRIGRWEFLRATEREHGVTPESTKLRTALERSELLAEQSAEAYAAFSGVWSAVEIDVGIGLAVACMTMAFLNCRNIVRVDNVLTQRKPKPGAPLTVRKSRFYTLRVAPVSKSSVRAGAPAAECAAHLPEHIVRGHFKRFTPERPLFGSIVGQFWWSPQVRGNRGNGRIEKAYQPVGPFGG